MDISKDMINVAICGSVDDGKSTLIGRLLFEKQLTKKDTLKSITKDGVVDYSLLLDGLQDERDQGITIDVAYRQVFYNGVRINIIDCPGHVQYTRNMVTGVSNADVGILVIDAKRNITDQTKRHLLILSLLKIKSLIFVVNKMDLVDFSKEKFDYYVDKLSDIAKKFNIKNFSFVPVSALNGDNISSLSTKMDWYTDLTLFDKIIGFNNFDKDNADEKFNSQVQSVIRCDGNKRYYTSKIAMGNIKKNDAITIYPSNQKSKIVEIFSKGKFVEKAKINDTVALRLESEHDVNISSIFTNDEKIKFNDFINATIICFSEKIYQQRKLFIKIGHKKVNATIIKVKNKIDFENLSEVSSEKIEMNDICQVEISLDENIFLTKYEENRFFGSFILIDPYSYETVACGIINFPLYRSGNVRFEDIEVTQKEREKLNNQKATVLWLTGLSGSGKSTIANKLNSKLFANDYRSYILDGDNVRHGLNRDLGFSDSDRVENIRRIAEVANLFCDAGMITLVSFISPFASERRMAKELIGEDRFIEIFVNTSIEACIKRDVKGLYKKALDGKIKNFTGVSSAYEEPKNPKLTISTEDHTVEESADIIYKYLLENKII